MDFLNKLFNKKPKKSNFPIKYIQDKFPVSEEKNMESVQSDINESSKNFIENNFNFGDTSVKINSFVEAINQELLYHKVRYEVGKDIPEGEYYFYGKALAVFDGNGKSIQYKERTDFYLDLKKGEIIDVIGGTFLNINNIRYLYKESDELVIGHMYRIEKEIPLGIYKYKYMNVSKTKRGDYHKNECEIHIYHEFPDTRYYRSVSSDDTIVIDLNCKYIEIYKGIAIIEKKCKAVSFVTKQIEYYKGIERHDKFLKEINDTSKIYINNRIYFYAYIEDLYTEIFINHYFKDSEKILSIYEDDNTINYKFSVSIQERDKITIILYLMISRNSD